VRVVRGAREGERERFDGSREETPVVFLLVMIRPHCSFLLLGFFDASTPSCASSMRVSCASSSLFRLIDFRTLDYCFAKASTLPIVHPCIFCAPCVVFWMTF